MSTEKKSESSVNHNKQSELWDGSFQSPSCNNYGDSLQSII